MTQAPARAGTTAAPEAPARWYAAPWVTIAAMYVFLPAGLYHMWRFRRWPRWLKWFSTVFGPAFAAVSGYVASAYIWPRIF
jgi:hypothetical protein